MKPNLPLDHRPPKSRSCLRWTFLDVIGWRTAYVLEVLDSAFQKYNLMFLHVAFDSGGFICFM